ncbi:hypothetical protein J6590_002508 [Homalodisca vitripennis]|nr:hypothetical protein J6590_002508 [Homalodisca vitripennis]
MYLGSAISSSFRRLAAYLFSRQQFSCDTVIVNPIIAGSYTSYPGETSRATRGHSSSKYRTESSQACHSTHQKLPRSHRAEINDILTIIHKLYGLMCTSYMNECGIIQTSEWRQVAVSAISSCPITFNPRVATGNTVPIFTLHYTTPQSWPQTFSVVYKL